MKSRRSWLMGLALGAALFFGTPSANAQSFQNSGVPAAFTYQGLVEENNTAITGNADFTVTFFDKAVGGNNLYSLTFPSQPVTNGIFNLLITGIPNTMSFNEQYWMQVAITTSNGSVTLAPVPLEAVPYALNAGTVNGLEASATPVEGDLFPVPIGTGYTGTAKVDPAFLPSIPNNLLQTPDIQTINGIGPDANGKFTINPGTGITITPGTNEITISTTAGGGGVTNNFPGAGININSTGPNGTGQVTIGIAPGGISGNMLPPGVVTGQKISGIAGAGLLQDAAGLLDVNVDNKTIMITSLANGNLLEVDSIYTANIANGAVTNAKIATPYIGFTSTGNTLLPTTPSTAPTTQLGSTENYDLNLGHSNDWTVVQAFHNVNDTGTVANVGAFNETGASTIIGAVTQTGGNVGLAGTAGNTLTVGLAGGANSTTINGALTQSGGATSINNSSNFATTINTGTSTGNVSIGNDAANQTNGVTIEAGTGAGSTGVNILGPTTINATSLGAGLNPTSVGNTANTYTLNASNATVNTAGTWGGTIGTTYTLTAGTSTSETAPSNSITATTGSNTILGTTNVNVTGGAATNIGTSTASTTSIGVVGGTNNIAGTTNVNTLVSSPTNIGNAGSTTTVLGPTNINTSGASATTIGSLGNNQLTINATTTHNGPTIFNNNITQPTTGTAQFNNTQINGNLSATGTLTSQTAGDNFSGNNVNTPTLTLSNTAANGNALSVGSGISTFGTLSVDGNKLVINGLVTTPPVPANDYELVVNGDAQITGSLGVVNLTTSTITATTSVSSPLGNFDNLSTYTPSNTVININRGLNQTSSTTNTFTGPVSVNGGLTSGTGTVNVAVNEAVAGNETVAGTLGVTGATNLSTLTTSGLITDNSNNFDLGTPGGAIGDLTVNQASHVGSPYTYTFPDSSGTVALLQNIAAIGQGTVFGQTLYWTGTTNLPNNSWQPTNLINQNPNSNTVTLLPGATLNASQNTASAFGGTTTLEGTLVTITTTSVNLGSGTLTSVDPFFEGNSQGNNGLNGADAGNTWWTVYGHVTPWLTPPFSPAPTAFNLSNQPILPAITPFGSLADFEQVIQGDLEVTGTIYNAAIYASLAAAQQLRFDNAEPFTLASAGSNPMTFNGIATLAGTPVVDITNVPAGSWGEQITVGGTAAGGLLVDPGPIGVDISATATGLVIGGTGNIGLPLVAVSSPVTGANIQATGTGEIIGGTVTPTTGTNITAGTTGENISAGTTGVNVTTAPTSFTGTGTVNTTGTVATGSTFTSGLSATTYTLSVANTAGSANTTDALNVTGAMNQTGNATVGTNAGTTNTFGNGGTASNQIGSLATTNQIGIGATTNQIGIDAATNTYGSRDNGGTTNNSFGIAQSTAGSTVNNTIGTASSAPATTVTNTIGSLTGTVTNNIFGTTNINNAGTAGTGELTTVGNQTTAADLNWFSVDGVITNSTFPPALTKAQLIAATGIAANQFEITDNGDELVTGTVAAGQVTTGLLSAPNIRFNDAQPYTLGGTMLFDGSAPQGAAAGTPVVTISSIPTNSYGLQVNGASTATTGGGIQVTGNGFGTGINIDPFPTGIAINATTTGINITGAAASVTATGTISSTGTTNGATGSVFTANNATVTTLTVNNTNASGIAAPALAVGEAFTSAGNSTVGTAAGTTNTFGNGGGGTTNNIGNTASGAATNTIGGNNGSGTVNNAFGISAGAGTVINQIGINAGTNTVTNTIGQGNSVGTTNNGLGNTVNPGATDNNTIGTAVAGSTATTTIGSLTGTTNNSMLATGTNTITGLTNINTTGGATTNVGTGAGPTNVGNTTTGTNINGASLNLNVSDFNETNIGTGQPGITNIGVAGATITILGTTNINTTGNSATAIGNFPTTAWGVTAAGAANFPSIGIGGAGSGAFTTLTSSGNSTIGVGILATVNAFGTAGNLAAASNTIGSTFGASTTTINGDINAGVSANSTANSFGTGNGAVTVSNVIGSPVAGSATAFSGSVSMSGLNQATDELLINNVPGGFWGERITSNTGGAGALGLIVNATATAGSAVAGSFTATSSAGSTGLGSTFTATGAGSTNTGISVNASGASTIGNVGSSTTVTGATPSNSGQVVNVSGSTASNIGSDVTATGTGSVGVRVNSGSITGESVDASGAATLTGIAVNANSTSLVQGINITGIQTIGENATFSSGAGGFPAAYNVDMTNASTANYSGYRVQSLHQSNTNGILIQNMSGGDGVNVAGITGGFGVNVQVGSANAVGIQSDVSTGSDGGTALQLIGNGAPSNPAMVVSNGSVVAKGVNPFAGSVSYGGTGFSPVTITNNLVTTTSSILVTYTMSGTGNGATYMVSVQNQGTGTFQVNCSSPNPGTITYIIINPN